MAKPRLRLVASTTENRTVVPRRPKNGDIRSREHLTIDEVERLIEAAKSNRYGQRDALMVLLAFRHGLRAGEMVDLRWGPGRLQSSFPARPPPQEWHTQHAPLDRARASGAATPPARKRKVAICVRVRARRANVSARLLPHGRKGSSVCEARD